MAASELPPPGLRSATIRTMTMPATLAGAALLLAADCAVRLIPSGAEVRIGVLTALLGVPVFLWIIARRRGELADVAA